MCRRADPSGAAWVCPDGSDGRALPSDDCVFAADGGLLCGASSVGRRKKLVPVSQSTASGSGWCVQGAQDGGMCRGWTQR